MVDLNEQRKYFKMHDPTKSEFSEIIFKGFNDLVRQIEHYNSKQYGIFKTVNRFDNDRKADQCTKILAWAADLDDESKEYQELRINSIGLTPSEVIESKNGYHVYWHVKGEATAENYKKIMKDYIAPLYKADKKATDISRVLRLENTLHWKDKNDPFSVKRIFKKDISYTEEFMLTFLERKALELGMNKEEKNCFPKIVNVKSRDAKTICDALGGYRLGEGAYQARCPAHPDRTPSLSITQKGDTVVFYCHANCSQNDVLKALVEMGLW